MRKAVGLVVLVAAMAFVGVAVAAPGHTVTVTQPSHTTDTHPDTQPCNGDPVLLTQTTDMINHVTYFPGGDEAWGTFTASYITYHEVAHETFDQNGNPVVQFDRSTMTCG